MSKVYHPQRQLKLKVKPTRQLNKSESNLVCVWNYSITPLKSRICTKHFSGLARRAADNGHWDKALTGLVVSGLSKAVVLTSQLVFVGYRPGQRPYIIETMHSYTLPM